MNNGEGYTEPWQTSDISSWRVLVADWILVTRVADEYTLFDDELEGFVLSAFERSVRQLETVELMR